MLRLQDIPQEAESRTGLQGSFSINLKVIYNTARCLPPFLPLVTIYIHTIVVTTRASGWLLMTQDTRHLW